MRSQLATCCFSWMNTAACGSVLGLHLTSGRAGLDSNVTEFPSASWVHYPFKDQRLFFSAERNNPAAMNYEQSLTSQSNNQLLRELFTEVLQL